MKYQIKGNVTLKIPEGVELFGTGETKEEALFNLLNEILEDLFENEQVVLDEVTFTRVRKVFKVKVMQSFINEVEIDTDEYPDIEDETDAERYVDNNLYEFESNFDYDDCTLDDTTVECDSWHTREETIEE